MTLTTFVGVPFKVYHKFIEQEDAENKQLDAIAKKYDKRYDRRESKIASLKREIERLETRQEQERRIWHNVLDRHIARNKRICAMFDELKEARENGYVEDVEALPF